MDDWVERHDTAFGVGEVLGDDEKIDNEVAIIMEMQGDPLATRLWAEKLPELAEGRTHLLIRTSTAAVIIKALDGGWVPRPIRNEALADFRATLEAERQRVRAELQGISAALRAADAEADALRAEVGSLEAAIAEYDGVEVDEAPSVIAGIHRRLAGGTEA